MEAKKSIEFGKNENNSNDINTKLHLDKGKSKFINFVRSSKIYEHH